MQTVLKSALFLKKKEKKEKGQSMKPGKGEVIPFSLT